MNGQAQPTPSKTPKGDPLNTALVKEFVGAAHKDFEKMKTLLLETPDLLNAVNNLGGWDWEDAIGAPGHVGDREMTLFLLEKGARPTICTAAMLGELKVVKDFIKAFPHMKNAVGPHNISLMRHAKAGGEPAEKVLKYLVGIGAKE
ncbi:MAG: ankyrin repeat domain-containing protein [Lewinellaceae bacterium]|nr:ankyrin repeat domain-containing protein [Lewinellaceae bacterium]